MAPAWNYENAAHLLRRAAFGGTPEEIQAFLGRHTSVASAVDELLSFKPSKKKPPSPRNVNGNGLLQMQAWWLAEMINATPPEACQEKLTLFWHGHLVSGASKQPTLGTMSTQNALFRFHARGNFKTLVREFNRDPANLYYLDGITNVASTDGVHVNANENFPREVMELFVLGVFQFKADGTQDPSRPNYSETDVHQLARALTGWTSIARGVGVWNQGDWDGGQYDDDGDDAPDDVTIFGVTNNNFRIDAGVAGTANDVLGLLLGRNDYEGQNTTGVFLSRKLWSFYAYPPQAGVTTGLKALLNGFAANFAAGNFELTPLLRAMWTHDEFYSARARSRTVKNPTDFVVQAFKAFGVRSNGKQIAASSRPLGDQVALMGMNLFEPPSVGGWNGGLAWISVGTLLTRCEFARDLARAAALDPKKIAGLLGSATADPGATVDRILAQVGLNATPVGTIPPSTPVTLNANQRAALIAYATDGGSKPTLNLKAARGADVQVKVRGIIGLALQAAEYQVF